MNVSGLNPNLTLYMNSTALPSPEPTYVVGLTPWGWMIVIGLTGFVLVILFLVKSLKEAQEK